jgi:hypothetical protein
LLIVGKISLSKVEKMIFISRFEYVCYMFVFLEYIIWVYFIVSNKLTARIELGLPMLNAFIACFNYILLRTSFYNKLRIRARII